VLIADRSRAAGSGETGDITDLLICAPMSRFERSRGENGQDHQSSSPARSAGIWRSGRVPYSNCVSGSLLAGPPSHARRPVRPLRRPSKEW